jgi:hypothetical protein
MNLSSNRYGHFDSSTMLGLLTPQLNRLRLAPTAEQPIKFVYGLEPNQATGKNNRCFWEKLTGGTRSGLSSC